MNYQVYNMGAYRLHCVRSTNFKKTSIIINFKRKSKKTELSIRTLLPRVLMESSKRYKTMRSIVIETENLYNLSFNSSSSISGNYNIIRFESSFLNNDYTDDMQFNNAIDFILELITNPNVTNGSFDKKSFELAKSTLKTELDTFKDDPNRYSAMRLFEEIDKKSIYANCILGTEKQLQKITPKSLYTYYKGMIESDQIDIFIISPLDKETVKKVFEKKLVLNERKPFVDPHYIYYDKYRKRAKMVFERGDYEQSKLLIACKFDELTPFEIKYVSAVYSYILGGGPSSKLFQTVREKNSLCYSISSSFKLLTQYLVISSGINPDSFKNAYKLIKKEIKDMAKGKFDEGKIKEAQVTYLAGIEELKDSPMSILSTYISHDYLDIDLLDERASKIGEVTYDMVVNFAKKVHIDTVYILEGGTEDAED